MKFPKNKWKKPTISFAIPTKRIKYLGIYLRKNVKDLYTDNHKILFLKIEEDTKKWKDVPCSLIGRLNIVKMAILMY